MGAKPHRGKYEDRGVFRGHLPEREYKKVRGAVAILEEIRREEERMRSATLVKKLPQTPQTPQVPQTPQTSIRTQSVPSVVHLKNNHNSWPKKPEKKGVYDLSEPLRAPHIFSTSSSGLDRIKDVNCAYFVLIRECDMAGGHNSCRLKDARVLTLQNEESSAHSLYKFTCFRKPRSLRDMIEYNFSRLVGHFGFKKPKLRDYIRASQKCEDKFNTSRQRCGRDIYTNMHIVLATIDLVEIPEDKVLLKREIGNFFKLVPFGDFLKGEIDLGLNGHILLEELWTLFD